MSEFWVSKKRYYCKYCEIYIADDQPSRQQHENGLRHKGNRDRFIRGLYKQGEKRKKDQDEEKREIERIEKLAQAAYAQDVGAGRGGRSQPTASSSKAPAPVKKPTKPSDPYANYSTAASLGFVDPDVECLNAERERKNTQGVAGEWEVVGSEPTPTPGEMPDSETTTVPQKRRAEEASVPGFEDTRFFKLQKRTLATGLGELYDPGIITLKPKTKPTTKHEEVETKVEEGTTSTLPVASMSNVVPSERPKWTSRSWQQAPEDSAVALPYDLGVPAEYAQQEAEATSEVKSEETEIEIKQEDVDILKQEDVEVKQEVQPPASSSRGLFKKRKIPNAGRVRT